MLDDVDVRAMALAGLAPPVAGGSMRTGRSGGAAKRAGGRALEGAAAGGERLAEDRHGGDPGIDDPDADELADDELDGPDLDGPDLDDGDLDDGDLDDDDLDDDELDQDGFDAADLDGLEELGDDELGTGQPAGGGPADGPADGERQRIAGESSASRLGGGVGRAHPSEPGERAVHNDTPGAGTSRGGRRAKAGGDDAEAGLDEILRERLRDAGGAVDDGDGDGVGDEATLLAGPDEDDDEDAEEVVRPRGADEFVCRSCFLVKAQAQLADPVNGLCADCADSVAPRQSPGGAPAHAAAAPRRPSRARAGAGAGADVRPARPAQPLTTPSGRSRATRRASPARSQVATTSSTSL